MPKRKLLKGIVTDIADSFVHRNNDVDGYWAPGKLYSECLKVGDLKVVIDLLQDSNDLSLAVKQIRGRYRDFLFSILSKIRLTPDNVHSAQIYLEFETYGD